MFKDVITFYEILYNVIKNQKYVLSDEEIEIINNDEIYEYVLLNILSRSLEKNNSSEELNRKININLRKYFPLNTLKWLFPQDKRLCLRNTLCHYTYEIKNGEIDFNNGQLTGHVSILDFIAFMQDTFELDPENQKYLASAYYLKLKTNNLDNNIIEFKSSETLDARKIKTYEAIFAFGFCAHKMDESKFEYNNIDLSKLEYRYCFDKNDYDEEKERLKKFIEKSYNLNSDYSRALYKISREKTFVIYMGLDHYDENMKRLSDKETYVKERKERLLKQRELCEKKLEYIQKKKKIHVDNCLLLKSLRNCLIHDYYELNDNKYHFYYQKEGSVSLFEGTISFEDMDYITSQIIDGLTLFENYSMQKVLYKK